MQLALVTGATSGIGTSLCRLLANQGIALIATGRRTESLNKLQEQLSKQVPISTLAVDLAQANERQKLIHLIHSQTPDLIINNAGFGLYGDCLNSRTDEQKAILEVNGMAVLEISLEAARALASKNKKGVIMNISSIAAFNPSPGMNVYAAAKTFVNHFSLALNAEVQQYGIRVLTACPGIVETQFRERAKGQVASHEEWGAMTADFVAEKIWLQIQSCQPLSIIDWKYHLLIRLSSLLPQKWIMSMLKKKIAKIRPPQTFIKIDS